MTAVPLGTVASEVRRVAPQPLVPTARRRAFPLARPSRRVVSAPAHWVVSFGATALGPRHPRNAQHRPPRRNSRVQIGPKLGVGHIDRREFRHFQTAGGWTNFCRERLA
jgi:hypothetical protein